MKLNTPVRRAPMCIMVFQPVETVDWGENEKIMPNKRGQVTLVGPDILCYETSCWI